MAIRTLMLPAIPGVRPSLHISGGVIFTYDDSMAGHMATMLQEGFARLNTPVPTISGEPVQLPQNPGPYAGTVSPPQGQGFDPTKQSVGHQPTGDFDPRQITPPAANGGTMSVIDGVPQLPQPPIATPPRPPPQFDPTAYTSAPPTGQPHRRTVPLQANPSQREAPQAPQAKPARFPKAPPPEPARPTSVLGLLRQRRNAPAPQAPHVPTAVPGATPTAAEIVARDGDMQEVSPGAFMGPDGTIWQSATKDEKGRPIVPMPQPPISPPPMPPSNKS